MDNLTEAPKKIYFSSTEDGTHYYTEAIPFEREYIEYTRTDAFIEKAENWLYLQLNEINMKGEDMENFLKDFKNYVKGE